MKNARNVRLPLAGVLFLPAAILRFVGRALTTDGHEDATISTVVLLVIAALVGTEAAWQIGLLLGRR